MIERTLYERKPFLRSRTYNVLLVYLYDYLRSDGRYLSNNALLLGICAKVLEIKYATAAVTSKNMIIIHHQDIGTPIHRLFEGGGPIKSSAAFLFDPKPKATFVRSEGTGVPVCVGVSAADEIREKPGFIAGGDVDPLAGTMDVKPDGAGL